MTTTACSTTRRIASAVAVGAAICLVAATALAEAGFQYKVNKRVQADQGYPALVLQATGAITGGEVRLKRSDGERVTVDLGRMSPGQTKTIPLKQPAGTFHYDVEIEAKGGGDETVDSAFDFDATLVAPLAIEIDPNRVRLGEGEIPLRTNRPLDRVDIEVFDAQNRRVYANTQSVGGKSGTITVEFEPHDDVAGIKLKAHDVDGFWQSLMLEPFWVEIPHKEVNFETGKASWGDDQEPKLTDTLAGIREAMKEHAGKGLQMQLYVAGYTDTVGSKADNRKLSTARAKAIARWFRRHGLAIPIFYQGFGEAALAVQTADETENEQNRRALYILGNARPPTSGQLPRSDWRAID